MADFKDPKSGAAALGGAALIVFGLWFLIRTTGIIPAQVLKVIGDASGALVLIALGVLLVMFARRGRLQLPPAGTKLFRSRDDKWIGGVLGGLGKYLGVDPVLLRIATIVLAVLGVGSVVIAYIVLWIVVPEEPLYPAAGPTPYPPTGV
jgi:phage shock protein PspC (stress-responsive transcriptional regulator)